ncbi:MAG: hypothetical protein KKG75_02025 [Nanoarchaeota archaeon]|nr:hypothetical protein [Nanoarchaeota archaeon]
MTYLHDDDKVVYPNMDTAVSSLTRADFVMSADASQPDYFLVGTRGCHRIGLKFIREKGDCQAVPLTENALEFLLAELSKSY